MVQTASNPYAMLNQIIQSNPQAQQVMQMIQSGGNVDSMLYTVARQKGIDPNELLNLLK